MSEPEPVTVEVETTNVAAENVEKQQTGLADIAPPPTSQTGNAVVKPFTANPAHLKMARRLRGAELGLCGGRTPTDGLRRTTSGRRL